MAILMFPAYDWMPKECKEAVAHTGYCIAHLSSLMFILRRNLIGALELSAQAGQVPREVEQKRAVMLKQRIEEVENGR